MNDANASVASAFMRRRVPTRESISHADWSVDPRGGPTVDTKDWPIAFGFRGNIIYQKEKRSLAHITCFTLKIFV
jgi:hypothetical protein